ncbi:MAG: ATP-binding protein [Pseudomonadota bacterium]
MTKVHLMVGLPCAGKTTYAKKLEKEMNALRLTPDEWHIRLFGQDVDDPDHNRRHDTIEDLLWNVAASVLGHGVDVILDFGFWKRIEREDYRARAKGVGASSKIHFLNVSEDVLMRRLTIRNDIGGDGVARIPPELLQEWFSHFEPPGDDELI